MAPFNFGQVGSLLTKLPNAAKWALGGTGGTVLSLLELEGDAPQRTMTSRNPYTDTRRGLANLPPTYRGDELQMAAAARAAGGASAGGGIGGGNMASYIPASQPSTFGAVSPQLERAYQDEKRRATQLSEQDPLFKKYQVADLTKAYNAAKTPEEKEKLGLQIWATTNPQLAQKLKPGQLGYSEASTAFQAISPLGQFKQATGDMEYANKIPEMQANMAAFNLETPLTGVQIPPTNQIGVAEQFASASPLPGAMEAFTNPLQFFAPDKLNQTQQALIKRAFEERLK